MKDEETPALEVSPQASDSIDNDGDLLDIEPPRFSLELGNASEIVSHDRDYLDDLVRSFISQREKGGEGLPENRL